MRLVDLMNHKLPTNVGGVHIPELRKLEEGEIYEISTNFLEKIREDLYYKYMYSMNSKDKNVNLDVNRDTLIHISVECMDDCIPYNSILLTSPCFIMGGFEDIYFDKSLKIKNLIFNKFGKLKEYSINASLLNETLINKFDDRGNLIEQFLDGFNEKRKYDSKDRVILKDYYLYDKLLYSENFEYLNDSNLNAKVTTDGPNIQTICYKYYTIDNKPLLIVNEDNSYIETYEYDKNGNIFIDSIDIVPEEIVEF